MKNYPVLTDIYIDNEWFSSMEYEYYDLVDMEENQLDDTYEILGITFYNLLGQQIEKPASGIYIEQITTTKGINSAKKCGGQSIH